MCRSCVVMTSDGLQNVQHRTFPQKMPYFGFYLAVDGVAYQQWEDTWLVSFNLLILHTNASLAAGTSNLKASQTCKLLRVLLVNHSSQRLPAGPHMFVQTQFVSRATFIRQLVLLFLVWSCIGSDMHDCFLFGVNHTIIYLASTNELL